MQLTNRGKFRFLVFALLSLSFINIASAADEGLYRESRHSQHRPPRSSQPAGHPTIHFAQVDERGREDREGFAHESRPSTPAPDADSLQIYRRPGSSYSRVRASHKYEWTPEEIEEKLREVSKPGEIWELITVDFRPDGIVRRYEKKKPEPGYIEALQNSASNFVWYCVFPFCVYTIGKHIWKGSGHEKAS